VVAAGDPGWPPRAIEDVGAQQVPGEVVSTVEGDARIALHRTETGQVLLLRHYVMYAVYISRRSMHRTQIYLSSEERQGLQALARQVGRSQSDLIREAIDGFLERHRPSERLSRMRRARGLWSDREDIPSLAILRGELDRMLPAEGSADQRP